MKKLKNKEFLHKVGWTLLVLVLICTLAMIVFLISQTTEVITPLTDNQTASEDMALDQELDAEIESALEANELATLSSVRNIESEYGVATRSYANGLFEHTVILSISDPPSGTFYEGWLAEGKIVSTGKFIKEEADTYTLVFTSTEDLSDLSNVIITQESLANGLDGKPELHILEGSFKN
jgi:hypothetical protein